MPFYQACSSCTCKFFSQRPRARCLRCGAKALAPHEMPVPWASHSEQNRTEFGQAVPNGCDEDDCRLDCQQDEEYGSENAALWEWGDPDNEVDE